MYAFSFYNEDKAKGFYASINGLDGLEEVTSICPKKETSDTV